MAAVTEDTDDADDAERLVVYSDYVCPFCYLGRASLRQYLEANDADVEVDWHPFDLRARKRGPDGEIDFSVDDGKDEAYYEQARENVRRLRDRYDVEMAREIATDVDSLPAQAASLYVKEAHPEQWSALDRAIFEALWVDGRDVGDPAVLVDVAESVGLDGEAVREALDDDSLRERVTEQFEAARRRGVTAVPTFVYDGHVARGAVPPEQLARLIEG